jgi:hypothetical protein
MEKTEEKSRLTVDLFLSSEDSAEFRCALLMLLSKDSIIYLLDYYNRKFISSRYPPFYLSPNTKLSHNQ